MSHFVMELFKVYWDALSAANTRQRLILECHDDLQTFCDLFGHEAQSAGYTPRDMILCYRILQTMVGVYNIQKK